MQIFKAVSRVDSEQMLNIVKHTISHFGLETSFLWIDAVVTA